jgi:signal transduction histidine kinase/HAMP domain-containing protein
MRLEWKVTVWMAVLLGAAAALALFMMVSLEATRMERQWTDTGLAIAQATENTLEISMLNDAPDDVGRAVRNVREGHLIQGVTVYGRDGDVWVSSEDGLPSDVRGSALLASMASNASTTVSADDSLSVFVPIEKQDQCTVCHTENQPVLGAVEVRIDEAPFRAEVARNARASLVAAAIPLALGIVATVWAIRRRVLRPLAEVDAAVEQLGGGDLYVRLPAYRDPEFGEVAETFNDMAGRLERQSADLRGAVESLRSEVSVLEEIRALLTDGADLSDVLQRSAVHLASALEATGVAILRTGDEDATATWGTTHAPLDAMRRTAANSVAATSEGPLLDLPADRPFTWASVPAEVRGEVLAVVGLGWMPPRTLDATERDLVMSLSGLIGIAVDNVRLLERLQEKEESLQALVRKTLTAQEEERRRIARELHDETSQVLSALLMNISVMEAQAPVDEPSLARIEAVKALAEEAARNLDTMLFELRPALLDELGLIPAIRWYLAQVSDAWGIPISFEGENTGRLADHVEVTAFRIVQEAVGNVVRHAEATSALVRITARPGMLHVEISDDGVGFEPSAVASRARTGESVGLMGMRERATLAGGTLSIASSPGSGTRLVAELPLEENEKKEVG